MPTAQMDASLCQLPYFPSSYPANGMEKAAEDGPSVWAVTTHIKDLGEPPGFSCQLWQLWHLWSEISRG